MDHVPSKCFYKLLQEFRKVTLLTYSDINKQTFIFTYAHKIGLSGMLVQGENISNAKPVAMVSKSTSKIEQNYAQLDLESMAVDYALRCFFTCLIRFPNEDDIVPGQLPFLRVFNRKRSRSIRTERIKLRHQGILFCLIFGKGRDNPGDYLSRNATQWKSVSKFQRDESKYITKFLHTLNGTSVSDALEIREIAKHSQTDTTLTKLKYLILVGKTYIPKNLLELQTLRNIFSEITVLNDGTLLKHDKILLPASLFNKALS